jgi:hypothetical protein
LARSSRGLGHHPLKVAARVRIPYGLPRKTRSEPLFGVALSVSQPRCQWIANGSSVLIRFMLYVLAPVGVFQFGDWLR